MQPCFFHARRGGESPAIFETSSCNIPDQHALLIIIDCLVLLDILMQWGKSEFQPSALCRAVVWRDIVHFDVLAPLLTELRLWPGTVLLMKFKSHAGCLLNERADELADIGVKSEVEPISPGPSKHGSVWLRIRESWRQRVCAELHHILPRDTARHIPWTHGGVPPHWQVQISR